MDKKMTTTKSGFLFFLLAMLAFLGLGLEIPMAFFIEPVIWKKNIYDFNTTQNIVHWIITCIIWGVSFDILRRAAKTKLSFNLLAEKRKLKLSNWLFCLALLTVCVVISVVDWDGLKVVKEFQYNGLLKFIFQYIYYIFETLLVLLIVIFGQRAGEAWLGSKTIPWGGILAGLTWGLVHMLTKMDLVIGLLSCLSALIFGIIYLCANRNFYVSYLFVFLAFVL